MPTPDQLKQLRANVSAHQEMVSRQRKNADPQESAQWTVWTVDPTRCAVSGADLTSAETDGTRAMVMALAAMPSVNAADFFDTLVALSEESETETDLTPADCGPGLGGAAQTPLPSKIFPCRSRHWMRCETPNACAGGGDCRLGPDLSTERRGLSATTDEPLYEECLAMQGPPEIVVNKEMIEAGRSAAAGVGADHYISTFVLGPIYRAMATAARGCSEKGVTEEMKGVGEDVLLSCGDWQNIPEIVSGIYRAMAAVAPREPDMRSAEKTKDELKNTGTEPLVIYDADHVAVHVVYPGETWTPPAPEIVVTDEMRDVKNRIAALEAENAKLRADPVELYRAEERKIDALETEVANRLTAPEVQALLDLRDNLIIELQKRISALHAENATLRTRGGERDASALHALRRRV